MARDPIIRNFNRLQKNLEFAFGFYGDSPKKAPGLAGLLLRCNCGTILSHISKGMILPQRFRKILWSGLSK